MAKHRLMSDYWGYLTPAEKEFILKCLGGGMLGKNREEYTLAMLVFVPVADVHVALKYGASSLRQHRYAARLRKKLAPLTAKHLEKMNKWKFHRDKQSAG